MSRRNEILAVKELGEKIGYGNMMDIASALWAMDLSNVNMSGRIIPCHVSTVLPCMKKKDAISKELEVLARAKEIKNVLI